MTDRPLSNARYVDFFAGFGFACATGDVTAFDENCPVCGSFGFPKILMTSWIPHSASRMLAAARGEPM
jgi:hypothetical protein